MSDFGAFGYALALAAAGRTLLSLGQGKLLSRFMAKYEEERDFDRMFGSMFLAVGTIVVDQHASPWPTLFLFCRSAARVGGPATRRPSRSSSS